jgi:hypothetical protein
MHLLPNNPALIPAETETLRLQRKPQVSPAGGALEIEAGAVAARIAGGAPESKSWVSAPAPAAAFQDLPAAEAPPIVKQALGSAGQSLDPATRAFMEPRLGADLGAVRIHTHGRAEAGPTERRQGREGTFESSRRGSAPTRSAWRNKPATPGNNCRYKKTQNRAGDDSRARCAAFATPINAALPAPAAAASVPFLARSLQARRQLFRSDSDPSAWSAGALASAATLAICAVTAHDRAEPIFLARPTDRIGNAWRGAQSA